MPRSLAEREQPGDDEPIAGTFGEGLEVRCTCRCALCTAGTHGVCGLYPCEAARE